MKMCLMMVTMVYSAMCIASDCSFGILLQNNGPLLMIKVVSGPGISCHCLLIPFSVPCPYIIQSANPLYSMSECINVVEANGNYQMKESMLSGFCSLHTTPTHTLCHTAAGIPAMAGDQAHAGFCYAVVMQASAVVLHPDAAMCLWVIQVYIPMPILTFSD